ncbi:unnamed protein product [Cunninghamella echinulata]
METTNRPTLSCLLRPSPDTRLFQPQAEDILSDEEPDAERIAKLIFCIHYSLGDKIKYYRPIHDDNIVYRDDINIGTLLHAVRISNNPSCCEQSITTNSSTINNNNTTSTLLSSSTTDQQQKQHKQQQQSPINYNLGRIFLLKRII